MPVKSQSKAQNIQSAGLSRVMLSRLPVYDDQLKIYAYELLPYVRGSEQLTHSEEVAQLIVNALSNFDLQQLVGPCKTMLTLTELLLSEVSNLPIHKESLVLVLPNNLSNKDNSKDVVKCLDKEGYSICAESSMDKAVIAELLPYIELLKLDVTDYDFLDIQKYIDFCRENENIELLVTGIKTLAEYESYRRLGLRYSQGYFLGCPVVYTAKNLESNLTIVLDLLSKVNDPEATVDEIGDTVKKDVALSFKLMRLINSPFFGLGQEIESVEQALVLLGRQQVRTWVSVLLLSGMDNCPAALTELVLFRAKFCELLAAEAQQSDKEAYFTVGMFSALDLLMQSSLEVLLEMLPLSEEIKQALLEKSGLKGEALCCVQRYEFADMDNVGFAGLSDSSIFNAYQGAVSWSQEIVSLV